MWLSSPLLEQQRELTDSVTASGRELFTINSNQLHWVMNLIQNRHKETNSRLFNRQKTVFTDYALYLTLCMCIRSEWFIACHRSLTAWDKTHPKPSVAVLWNRCCFTGCFIPLLPFLPQSMISFLGSPQLHVEEIEIQGGKNLDAKLKNIF